MVLSFLNYLDARSCNLSLTAARCNPRLIKTQSTKEACGSKYRNSGLRGLQEEAQDALTLGNMGRECLVCFLSWMPSGSPSPSPTLPETLLKRGVSKQNSPLRVLITRCFEGGSVSQGVVSHPGWPARLGATASLESWQDASADLAVLLASLG